MKLACTNSCCLPKSDLSLEKIWDEGEAQYVYILFKHSSSQNERYHYNDGGIFGSPYKVHDGWDTYRRKDEKARGNLAWAKRQSDHHGVPIMFNGEVLQ